MKVEKTAKKLGFANYADMVRFAKVWALKTIYHYDGNDIDTDVSELGISYAFNEIEKMKLPADWNLHCDYAAFKQWWIDNVSFYLMRKPPKQ